jgi:molybdopterin converting factor small subunit
MKLTVEYEAQVKKAAGIASEDVELDGPCTVQSLIVHVAEKHGDPLKPILIDSEGNLQKSILLFLGDRQIHWDDAPELSEHDVLTILSPISGG